MLVDAGPLIALFDEDDRNHARCMTFVLGLPLSPLYTTWSCLTEAMYLLNGIGGYRYQERLWRILRDGRLQIFEISIADIRRMDDLMAKYQDVPMDLADASLIAIAESHKFTRIFTIDSDFYIYRLTDGSILQPVP